MKQKRKSKEITKPKDSEIKLTEDLAGEIAALSLSDELTEAVNMTSNKKNPESVVTMKFESFAIEDLYPKYSYCLDSQNGQSELKTMLYAFLKSNEALLDPERMPNTVSEFYGFSQGFQRAIALVNLWLDSLA